MAVVKAFPCAIVLVCATSVASAATVDSTAEAHLLAEAKRSGAVAVTVNLATLSLTELGDPRKRTQAQAKAQRLLSELGHEIWADGRWDNSAGQAGFFVTEKGVEILKGSKHAVSFWPGQADALKERRMQPGFQAVEAALERANSAQVSIWLRNESLDYALERNGFVTFQASPAAQKEHLDRATRLIGQFRARIAADARPAYVAIAGLAPAVAGGPGLPLSLEVDTKALHALAHHPDVFRIEPAGYVDARPQVLDEEAVEVAMRDGSAELLLTLRTPMPLVGLSTAEHKKMKAANAKAFSRLLDEHGINRNYRDLSGFGAIAVRLTLAEIKRLHAAGDRRLLATSLNRPMGTTALATSTVQMNLPTYWDFDAASYPPVTFPDAGFRGAYPSSLNRDPAGPHTPISIVVMDSGAQRTHPMLSNRITFEACFGSDANVTFDSGPAVQFRSICPDRNLTGTGDSPLNNTAGQGNPHPQGIDCILAPNSKDACSHGTHVAGIAAGNDGVSRRGVAPSARIISAQVFSYDLARVHQPNFFAVDLLAALQAVIDAVPANSTNSDFVINMSLGGGLYGSACTSGSAPGVPMPPHPTINQFVTAVQQLTARGIPVVAATGNDASRNSISFPACLPGVVKVLAASNDSTGNTLALYSNLPNPATIGTEMVFLAPGGLSRTASPVVSAWIDPATQYVGIAGTSMATPHVSGLYALVKAGFKKLNMKKADGVTPHDMQDVNAWMIGSASAPLQFNVAPTGQPADLRTYRRVRLP